MLVSDVMDEISFILHSSTGVREMSTHVTTLVGATDLLVQVANNSRITRGLVEIGDELVVVDDVDDSGITIPPWGRMQNSAGFTTSGVHDIGTKVLNDPLYPRSRIFRAIQVAVRKSTPALFSTQNVTLPWTPRATYAMPLTCDRVLSVYQGVPFGPPQSLDRWTFRTGDVSTSVTPTLVTYAYGALPITATVAMPLLEPSASTDTVAPLGWDAFKDVIVWGACWQLVQAMEPGRLANQSLVQATNATDVPYGSATKTAQQFYAMWQERLNDERKSLLLRHDSKIHRSA